MFCPKQAGVRVKTHSGDQCPGQTAARTDPSPRAHLPQVRATRRGPAKPFLHPRLFTEILELAHGASPDPLTLSVRVSCTVLTELAGRMEDRERGGLRKDVGTARKDVALPFPSARPSVRTGLGCTGRASAALRRVWPPRDHRSPATLSTGCASNPRGFWPDARGPLCLPAPSARRPLPYGSLSWSVERRKDKHSGSIGGIALLRV